MGGYNLGPGPEEEYKGFRLAQTNAYQGGIKAFTDKRSKKYPAKYWQIIKDGKRIDTALTRENARNRVNMILESST